MIFLTVGTEKFPFNRLIKALDDAVLQGRVKDKVFAQTGSSGYLPTSFPYIKFMSFNDMKTNIERSEIIVSHAGVGTTILALSMGKVPIIFPRKRCFGEHLDDHQLEFAAKMSAAGKVIVAESEEDLIKKVIGYKTFLPMTSRLSGKNKNSLMDSLRDICCGS